METKIHPTAIIEEGAEIGEGCRIGPFAIIEAGAKIGPDNIFDAGSHVSGFVEMGSGNHLMRGASLGGEPQSKKYQGETTWLKVGHGNWFGENTVVNRGTADKGVTTIGNHLFMMNGSHIGHDAVIQDHVIIGPTVNIGGEALIMDRANLGAGVGIHQFVRVGELAMAGGLTAVTQDVLPFTLIAQGGDLFGLNPIGIKRSGIYPDKIDTLKEMYRRLCLRRQPLEEFRKWLDEQPEDPFIQVWSAFLAETSKRGYARARARGGASPRED